MAGFYSARGRIIPPLPWPTFPPPLSVRLVETELTQSVLHGAPVYGADNQKVGKVDHVHNAGVAATVIVDVGGFLGIGTKPVAVPLSDLDFMRDEDGEVHAVTSWTKDQLKGMPEHRH